MAREKKQSGFTLIELLVAISIFAVFLVVSANSFTGILKLEQKANVLRQTQQDTRYIMESIMREARSANGELDLKEKRVAHAYSFDASNPSEFSIIFTSFEEGKVYQKRYFLDGGIVKLTTLEKMIGEADFVNPPTIVELNNPQNVKVISFSVEGSGFDDSDLDYPPILKLSIESESGEGRGFVRDEYRAYIKLESSVIPRSY